MSNKNLKGVTIFFTIFSLAVFLSSTVLAGGSFSIKWGNNKEPENNQMNNTYKHKKKGGPPPHAPAHGYRAKHSYYYYPASEVYFDSARGMYFYLSGRNWQMSANLPVDLKLRLGDHVTIQMDSDKPYVKHAEHKSNYPPGHRKDKSKQKFAKKNGNKHKKHK